jgi:hypothetical protein
MIAALANKKWKVFRERNLSKEDVFNFRKERDLRKNMPEKGHPHLLDPEHKKEIAERTNRFHRA